MIYPGKNRENAIISLPDASVIIPYHGSKNNLINCLNGLQKQDFNHKAEFIVVESSNGSEISALSGLYPWVSFYSYENLLFPGKARNMGAGKSRSEYLVFLDGDCTPQPYWLSGLYTYLKNGYDVVIGPILNQFPFHPVASVDNLLLFPDFQKYRPSRNFIHFPACNFAITRKIFFETGGFDEKLKTGEDTLFSSMLLKDKEPLIIYNNKAVVLHSGRKNFREFLNHHMIFGSNREYSKGITRHNLAYAILFGFRRLVYIIISTIRWNPAGILRIIIFSPFVIAGLSAWTIGFWRKNKKAGEA